MDALGLSADPDNEQVKELLAKMTVSSEIKKAIRAEMIKRYPNVKQGVAKLIGESFNFSEEELVKLIEFLESDIGKKFREKHADFTDKMGAFLDNEATAVMMSVTGIIQQEMNKALIEQGCDYKHYILPVKDWMGRKLKS